MDLWMPCGRRHRAISSFLHSIYGKLLNHEERRAKRRSSSGQLPYDADLQRIAHQEAASTTSRRVQEYDRCFSFTRKSRNLQFQERKLIHLPIFKSFFPDCKFITSTAHLAAMTCCNASVFNWPWLHLLVSTCLLDSSWPGCCLCKLTRTPEKHNKCG